MFCEQEDTVAVAWLLRECVLEKFSLLGSYLRPACDGPKRCIYHNGQELSEAFGSLFKGCGRWPEADDDYGIFNESSSDPKTIAEQLRIVIPDDCSVNVPREYNDLSKTDRIYFSNFYEF